MPTKDFYRQILHTLQGDTETLRAIPRERLDWAGPGALLDLYRKTSGNDRRALIGAIGQVIHKHEAPLPVLAEIIQIAAGLDLAELEPEVRKLQSLRLAADEPLRGAISNYLAFRKLAFTPDTLTPAPTTKLRRRPASQDQANGSGAARKAAPLEESVINANAAVFWLEAGEMGTGRSENALEMPDTLADFFGQAAQASRSVRIELAPGDVHDSKFIHRRKKYGHFVDRWRLWLPTARNGGPNYKNRVIRFDRTTVSGKMVYRMTVVHPNSTLHASWVARSGPPKGGKGRTTGNREYGWWIW